MTVTLGYDEIGLGLTTDSAVTRFKVIGGLRPRSIVSFPPKITQGDYTRDSHDILSSWVISDLSGGNGVISLKPTDENRYRFGTLYTRHPNQTSLPRKASILSNGQGANAQWPLGDHYVSGTWRFYSAEATTVRRWNESTDTWTDLAVALSAEPVNKAVEFKGTGSRRLYIPCSSTGYAHVNNVTLTNVAASGSVPGPIAFLVWDDKLIALDGDGQLWRTTDGATWTSYGSQGKLDAAFTPRDLVVYYDRQGNPIPYVISDAGGWAFDAAGPRLYRIEDLIYPPHPYQALGAAVWRADLYISNGMGVTRFTGNAVNPGVGLDRDDGLPRSYRGYIQDLEPEYNGLYALVVGQDAGGTFYASVQVFTGFGWHTEWSAVGSEFAPAAALSTITWMKVSKAESAYRLWWGYNEDLYSFNLPVEFTNPRALVLDSLGDFDTGVTHYLETGRFDAQMPHFTKIANAVHLTMEGGASGATMTNVTMTVKYRINGATAYTTLGSVTLFGETLLPFGTADSDGIYPGVSFDDIELKFEINKSSGGTTSPIIAHAVLTYMKVRANSFSWTAQIDLMNEFHGNSPDALADKLNALVEADTFIKLQHRDTAYRVRLIVPDGSDNVGQDTRGTRTVNILEVPTSLAT